MNQILLVKLKEHLSHLHKVLEGLLPRSEVRAGDDPRRLGGPLQDVLGRVAHVLHNIIMSEYSDMQIFLEEVARRKVADFTQPLLEKYAQSIDTNGIKV